MKGSTARIWHRLGAEVLQTRLLLVVVTWGWLGHGLSAQEPIELTLESAVSLAMRSSYHCSKVFALSAPDLGSTDRSEPKHYNT